MIKTYTTDLLVQGETPRVPCQGEFMEVGLHPNSGHFDQITLKNKPQYPLYHRKKTNGAIHWNPEIYTPPRYHGRIPSDWKPPQHVQCCNGSRYFFSAMYGGNLREIPAVDASVGMSFTRANPISSVLPTCGSMKRCRPSPCEKCRDRIQRGADHPCCLVRCFARFYYRVRCNAYAGAYRCKNAG